MVAARPRRKCRISITMPMISRTVKREEPEQPENDENCSD
jgi:hypothetical protein